MAWHRDVDVAPRPEFVDELEQVLLRELGDTSAGGHDRVRPPSTQVRAIPFGESRTMGRVARWGLWAAAAAAVVLTGTWALLRDGGDEVDPVDTPVVTTAPATAVTSVATATTTTSGATPPTSAAEAAAYPPRGIVPPGRYEVGAFTVPFSFETTSNWTREGLISPNVVRLNQTTGGPEVAITTRVFAGATPEEAVANVCPGAVELGAPEATTLLGVPAVRATGSVTTPCTIRYTASDVRSLDVGVTLEVTAAEVDGTVVTVVAGALFPRWEVTRDEVRALVASIRPISEQGETP